MTEQSARSQAGPVPSLDGRVKWLEGQVGKAAVALKRPELAQRAEVETSVESEHSMTIVVAGETSRGKSTLVNALLGRPGLLPAEADVTTNVYIALRHGEREHARIVVEPGGTAIEAPLAAVGEWATVSGNPDNAKSVRSVELFVDHPLLAEGLTVVDTPGVGGIEAAHADMTLVALSRADALMFVKDSKAPISGPESAFLTRAAERIETVIICLTKTDLFPGWETIAAQDREFLIRYLPRFKEAPILPVSAILAEAAASRAGRSPEVAARLRADSGIDELAQVIETRVVKPGVTLRLGNRVRGAISVIDELEGDVRARAGSARGDTRYRSDLETAHARVQEYRQGSSRWSVQLGDDVERLRSSLVQVLQEGVHEIRTTLAVTNLKRPEELQPFADDLKRRLNDLVARLNARLLDGISGIGERMRETLSLDGIEVPREALEVILEPPTTTDPANLEVDPENAATMARSLLGIVSPGLTFNFLLAATPFHVFAIPIGLALGIGLMVVERAGRTKAKGLNAARQAWQTIIGDATRRAEFEILPELSGKLLRARRTMELEVSRAVERRLTELTRAEDELKTLLQAEHNVKQKAIKDAETNIAALEGLRAKADVSLKEVSLGAALAGRSPVSAPLGVAPGPPTT